MSRINPVLTAFIVGCSLLLSCAKKEEKITQQQLFPICLELKRDIQLLPFSVTKNIPAYRPSEPHSEEEQETTPLFSQIEYVVYHKESGAIVKSTTFTEGNSDDFGAYIYDKLEAGTYSVVLLAHSSSDVIRSGNQAFFTDVSDSFHGMKEIIVGPESEGVPMEIVLKRIVARVEFVGTKSIPNNASMFVLEIEEQYNTTNFKDIETTNLREFKKVYPLFANTKPAEVPAYSFYTFVPDPLQGDTSFLSKVKLITLDINEDTLNVIQLNSVPVMKNRITRYEGSLYAPNTTSSTLELEVEDYGLWKDTINVPF